MTLIKYICGFVQVERCWFKEYINTTTFKAGFSQLNTDACILYRVKKLGTSIVILYTDEIMVIGDKIVLMDIIETTKK